MKCWGGDIQIFTYSLKRPGWDVAEPTLTASVIRHSFCPKDSQSAQHANVYTLVQVTDITMIGVELQITFLLEQNIEKQNTLSMDILDSKLGIAMLIPLAD